MLIIKQKEKSEPVTVTHTLCGKTISLTVRPWDEDEIDALRKKNTIYEFAPHPATGMLQRVPVPDYNALGEDLIDHLLVSFSGVGSAKDKPLEVTRENKLLLARLEPHKGEQSVQKKVLETAHSLEAAVIAGK